LGQDEDVGDNDSAREVMLAQEEAVIKRGAGARKGVEAAFGLGGETEGTLILTDRRLIYVHARDEKEVDLQIGAFSQKRLFFTDVESLDSLSLDSESLSIPLSSLLGAAGHRGPAIAPKLEVRWQDKGGAYVVTEFVEQMTGRSRRKNLSDWAPVIERLRTGRQKVIKLAPPPGADSLDGRILGVLGDMQEKGLVMIESEVEDKFGISIDPDAVEAACARLVASGLIRNISRPDEDPFYRKVSPLGEDDDLSA
jgi:hypothetical protein